MMETSLDIVSCYPANSYVAGSCLMKEFTFSGMKVRLWKSLIYRSNQRIQDFIYWYSLQSHMKGHKKESIHQDPLLCLPTFLHLMVLPLILICNSKKNQILCLLWQYKLDKIFYLTFQESRSLLSSMTAMILYALKCWWNHQSIISLHQSFQSEIDKHWLKVHLKLVLNCMHVLLRKSRWSKQFGLVSCMH